MDNLSVHVINDSDFKLWGKFGVIATPTVFLVKEDGKIELIKAGYGYDFAPIIKSKLRVILGIAPENEISDISQVKTVTNDSIREKANRHLKMAQMLEEKGNDSAALTQLETATQIDPNCIECSLELGRLYCKMAKPNKAIETVEKLSPDGKSHKAFQCFVLGKSYSQLGDFPTAEKYLLTTVEIDLKNSEAYYELGKIYQAQGQTDKAINSYKKALDLVYGD